MKIKDLPPNQSLDGLVFIHPSTKEHCIWTSQWGYPEGKAGIWYKKNKGDTQIHPLILDDLEEALEFEIV